MDSPFKIFHITQALSSLKPKSEIINTIQRQIFNTIYNKKMQLHVYQFMLYIEIWWFEYHPKIWLIFVHRFQEEIIQFGQTPVWVSCNNHWGNSISFRPLPWIIIHHKIPWKTLTNIIRMIRNIRFTTSTECTTITLENGANIEKMTHELPTICS